MMISKTNAVLDGVTSFLKYGTLDSSNSDVSTMGVEITTSVWVVDIECQQFPNDRPRVVREWTWVLKMTVPGFSCRGWPNTTKTTQKTGCRWCAVNRTPGMLRGGWSDHTTSVCFTLGCPQSLECNSVGFLSWILFALQENGQLKLNVQYVSMSAISQVRIPTGLAGQLVYVSTR